MIENADLLLQFAANLSKEEYALSVEKQYAMKFAFVMLGEDAGAISDELKRKYPVIPCSKSKACGILWPMTISRQKQRSFGKRLLGK